MPLTLSDLLALPSKPLISDIEFLLIQDVYDQVLMPYSYDYLLPNGKRIQLFFEKHRFCHLIGLESAVKGLFPKNRLSSPAALAARSRYKGISGWEGIKNGTIEINSFRAYVGKNHFNGCKDKLLFFYNLPKLLLSSTAMIRYVPIPTSAIQCELILFDAYDNSWVHIGLDKETDGETYYPRSFFIERITTSHPVSKYVDGQHALPISYRQRFARNPARRSPPRFRKKR
ncbi:hypothetical protein PAECIP111893_01213 [Paenibacillus plantiphilus]|uniref:Phage-Barnase-EndoU-ColicinE5/D-RelE like nuclease 4 domain-containing protein n=1 Tax=Paenibacillus plantiphilus TaxID=2905650 RepID=A0ABN8G3M0_9BACL|nr:PBECR4 domain-containing protein [Paenibacillus plantiphilus]CAH1199034.1 hypothetical protein PAECIP111893_01213 [Paenibacillus plantiphilus]